VLSHKLFHVKRLLVVHTYNPNTWEARQEDQEFQVSLGYIKKSYLKKEFWSYLPMGKHSIILCGEVHEYSILQRIRLKKKCRCWWFMPIFLATQEDCSSKPT
jgi:hypothetical protein